MPRGKTNFRSGTKDASTTPYVLPAPRKIGGVVLTDTVTITGTSKNVVRDAGNWPATYKVGMILSIDADTAASDDLVDWHYIVSIATDTIVLDRTHVAVASGACTVGEPSNEHVLIKVRNKDTEAANLVRYKFVHRGEVPPTEIDGEEVEAEQMHTIDDGLDEVTGVLVWADTGTPSVTVSYQGIRYINP